MKKLEEKFDLILKELSGLKSETQKINSRLDGIEDTISAVKTEATVTKKDLQKILDEQRSIWKLIDTIIMDEIRIAGEIYDFTGNKNSLFDSVQQILFKRYESLALNVELLNKDMAEVKRRLAMA